MALVISGALALGTPAAEASLEYPRIGYENKCRQTNCTITTSTAETDAEGASVINGLTYDFWQPTTVPGIVAFTFTEAVTADYCGIAGHTLTETGNQVELQYWDGLSPGSWVSLGSVSPGSETGNKTIMFLFDSVSSAIWRLIVSGGTGATAPVLGAVSIGEALVLERKIYGGHTPITLSKNTTILPQKSEGGQFLGRSIIREGASTSIALDNLTAAWVRSDFYPFMESARTYPFFFAWRPTATYSDEVAYCWIDKDIKVSNTGKANLMKTSFTVDAIVE
jgi:hypothetical protein